jgi:putative cell wall-binding protein
MERHHKRSPRRAIASIAAVLAAGSITGTVVPDAHAASGFALTRVAGANRYATAASLAAAAVPAGSDVAVLATGENYADALAGSFLAGRFGDGAPILLTARDALPAETSKALDDLDVTTVYLLGGTAAVSQGVEDALGERTVVRVAGANRYETAADIATLEAEGATAPGELAGDKTVIVASGEGFADALASGPLAFAGNLPVLLTPAGELSDAASKAIDDLGAERAVVVGGTAAVSAAVADDLEGKGVTVQRVAGANRYATAVAVADLGRTGLGLSSSAIDIASGENFPDALAAGPAAGVANRPLLLTASDELSEATEDYLIDHSATLTQGRVFGGSAAISENVVNQAEAAGGSGDELGSNRITSFDVGANTYTYVQDGADTSHTVHYDDDDDFTVDGNDAAVSGFEANLSVGDIITKAGDDHDLTNVSAGSFTSGTVGNVDTADHQLDIIDPVTGAAFRSNITYSGTFRVDAGAASMADFEAAINEGDTIAIEGGAFNLTNVVTTGAARNITTTMLLVPNTRFNIGALGDIYSASSDAGDAQDTNDDQYQANGGLAPSGQAFVVDGQQSDYDGFSGDLTEGDQVSYQRKGGVETFSLVNRQQATIVGQAVEGSLNPDGNGALGAGTPGGTFSVVDEDGEVQEITYAAGGTYVVDDDIVDEAAFEAAFSGGDEIMFRAADAASSTTQRIELDNEDLRGTVSDANTGDSPAPDADHGNTNAPHSYGVLADAGTEEIAQVEYADTATNEYYLNGTKTSLANFETALDNAFNEEADDAITIRRVELDNGHFQHRLEDDTLNG